MSCTRILFHFAGAALPMRPPAASGPPTTPPRRQVTPLSSPAAKRQDVRLTPPRQRPAGATTAAPTTGARPRPGASRALIQQSGIALSLQNSTLDQSQSAV